MRISDWSSDVCSSDLPTASLFLAQLALEAGLPPGVLNVVHGGPDTANGLCEPPDIKAVSFIGSTRVGTEIYNRASAAGKRCQRSEEGRGWKECCRTGKFWWARYH